MPDIAARRPSLPVLLAELAAVLLLDHYFPEIVVKSLAAVHVTVPETPLLKHAYLFFTFTLLLIAWLRWRGEALATFGLVRPPSWWRAIGKGVAIFVAIVAFDVLILPFINAAMVSLTHTSPTLAEQHFAPLKGNLPMLLYLAPVSWLFGGFGEEFVGRGYVMTRIAQLLGESRGAWIAALLLQGIPFAFGHLYQGPVGMAGIYVAALFYGLAYLWGRNLWPAMIAHALLDTFGFAAMYTGIVHA